MSRLIDFIKVSIVVPAYNMEKYLERCIQSLENQTHKNIEIILVNDGSTDGSADICKKYMRQDARVIYIEQENQGVSAARNEGLRCARGEWVAFVDGDDWVTPDMIDTLLNASGQYDIIIADAYTVEDDKITYASFYNANISDKDRHSQLYLIGNALGCAAYGATGLCNIGVPWARLYRREFLVEKKIEFPVGVRRMQDMIMNINAFCCTNRVGFCRKAVYYYRITSGSACRKYTPFFEGTAKSILSCIRETVRDNPSAEIRRLYRYKELSLLQETVALSYGHSKCGLSWEDKCAGIACLCEKPENKEALRAYEKWMFTKRQKVILYLLAHHHYRTLCMAYALRNMLIHRK